MAKLKLLILPILILLSAVFIGAGTDITVFAAEHNDHEHWWYITDYVEPTCTEQGYTEHHCYFCGESHKDNYITELGHSFLEVIIEPTCTARGYTTYFCTVCGFEYVDDYTEPSGHDFQTEVIAPTCTTDGYTLYTCQTCGFSYKDNYNYAFGHYFIHDVLEPTCTEEGYTTYTCYHCGDSYIDDFRPPNGHNHYEYVTLPTCVAYGYTEHICADCGDRFVTDYVKPHGHDYEKIVIKPTENTVGYTINLCKVCNYSYLSDFVTSGDIEFEEHNHEYSLFVARYDAQERFIVQNYCACGEIDNSLLKIIFIDENGDYTFLTPNYNGEVRYSHLYGDYNVYILSNSGEMLTNFKVRAGTIPEVHIHDYTLTVTRFDEDKYLTVSYDCDCGETDNSLLSIIFFDENGGYITINADESGKADYSALMHGDYNVFVLNNRGEMLSSFKLTIEEVVIPEEHFHDFLLSVTKNEDEKYFTVQYVCRCGEIQSGVFRTTFIDDNGNSISLTADEGGKVDYSQLCGNYNVFIFDGSGEMMTSFKLFIAEEHIHEFMLTVTKNDGQKYFTVEYLCSCGDIEQAAFHIIFIDKNGDSVTLNIDEYGKVDYTELAGGNYNVFILNNSGEILTSFNLSVAEVVIHYHDYSLSVIRNDNDKFFMVNYLCECGDIKNGTFQVLFVNENGNYITLSVDENGKVDYSQLVGKYNVFILGNKSEMLYDFKLTIAEVIPHSHDYELSVVRSDEEKYLTVNYLCDCGEIKNGVFSVNFIDNNGGSTIIYADINGKVDYSQLAGTFNVFVLNGDGEILSTFKLTVAPNHTHDYTLSVTRHDDQKYFVMEYLCDCGASETDTVYAIFMDEKGDYVRLTADEFGKVDYSGLIGKYNIFVMDKQGKLLSNFKLTIAEDVIHSHYFTLSVTRNDEQKYFTIQYLCDCGEVENSVFRVMFVDGNGNYQTINANANGEVRYSQLSPDDYNVFILNSYGEILQSFKLSVAEEVIHNHYYTLSIVRNDNEKYFTLKYVCGCGDNKNGTFSVMFIDESGNYLRMTVDENGKVDYSNLVGNFNVFIQDGGGEILSNFRLSVAEVHTHSYRLSVTEYEDERYFALQYICDCGETDIPVYHAIFIDENGNSVTKNANANGEISYAEFVGNYDVYILSNYGEILTSFTMSIEAEHIHGYSFSLARNDNEKYFVIKYICDCGETQDVVLNAVFIGSNGSYTTLAPNEYGKVDYSQLNGKYTVLIQNGQGEILANFTLSVGTQIPPEHIHEYTLSVTHYEDEKRFVLEFTCECGENKTDSLQVKFTDEYGESFMLSIDENGEVDYSQLDGDFTVNILNDKDESLSEFELSVDNPPIEDEDPPIEDDIPEEKSPLPVILAIMLAVIAAGGIAALIIKKKNKNKKDN